MFYTNFESHNCSPGDGIKNQLMTNSTTLTLNTFIKVDREICLLRRHLLIATQLLCFNCCFVITPRLFTKTNAAAAFQRETVTRFIVSKCSPRPIISKWQLFLSDSFPDHNFFRRLRVPLVWTQIIIMMMAPIIMVLMSQPISVVQSQAQIEIKYELRE